MTDFFLKKGFPKVFKWVVYFRSLGLGINKQTKKSWIGRNDDGGEGKGGIPLLRSKQQTNTYLSNPIVPENMIYTEISSSA